MIFSEALAPVGEFVVDSLPCVLDIAIGRGLAFCDVSCAFFAEKNGLKLVIEDADLLA